MQTINFKSKSLDLSDDEKVIQEALEELLAEGFDEVGEVELLVEETADSEEEETFFFEEELEGEIIEVEVLDSNGGYKIQNKNSATTLNAAKVGDKKVVKFKISAASLEFNLASISSVSGFISAAYRYAKKHVKKILAKVLSGAIAWGLFAWSLISAVFSGVAKKKGKKGLLVSVPMKYNSRTLTHGGKKYRIYQWEPNGKWKVVWY